MLMGSSEFWNPCAPCQCMFELNDELLMSSDEELRSFWYLQRQDVPFSSLAGKFGNWPELTNEKLYKAQSVYFFTLVIMQWG